MFVFLFDLTLAVAHLERTLNQMVCLRFVFDFHTLNVTDVYKFDGRDVFDYLDFDTVWIVERKVVDLFDISGIEVLQVVDTV